MSNQTEPVPVVDLRRMVRDTAAGVTAAALAKLLNDSGVLLPRDGAFDNRHAPASGYNIDNGERGNPSRWTAQAVTTVLACPEANPANGFAAARAKLGSDASTTLTVVGG